MKAKSMTTPTVKPERKLAKERMWAVLNEGDLFYVRRNRDEVALMAQHYHDIDGSVTKVIRVTVIEEAKR